MDNEKRPHLLKEQRIPKIYKSAQKILQDAKNKKGNIKTLLYSSRFRGEYFKRVYALVYKVVENKEAIDRIIESIELFKKEPLFNEEMAEILIYEIVFNKRSLQGLSKPIQIIKMYQESIEEAFSKLENSSAILDGKKKHLQNTGISVLPRYARVNTLLTTVPEVIHNLKKNGFYQIEYDSDSTLDKYHEVLKQLQINQFIEDFHFKEILVFCPNQNLSDLYLYKKGHIFLQDKTSYIPVHVLAPPPNSIVFDCCAAPGMKTVHLAASMKNLGKIFATDKARSRLEILKSTLIHGGVNICEAMCTDFKEIDPNIEPYSSVKYILLDPSCSGTGMVSRLDALIDDPNSKNAERIEKLAGFQIILLKHALSFPSVKRVVYSTCSVTEKENEYVIQEVLNHYYHIFKVVSSFPEWPTRGSENYEFGPLCVRAFPDKNFTNGFFVAAFERICNDSDHLENKFKNKKMKQNSSMKKLSDMDSRNKGFVGGPLDGQQQNINYFLDKQVEYSEKASEVSEHTKQAKKKSKNKTFKSEKCSKFNINDCENRKALIKKDKMKHNSSMNKNLTDISNYDKEFVGVSFDGQQQDTNDCTDEQVESSEKTFEKSEHTKAKKKSKHKTPNSEKCSKINADDSKTRQDITTISEKDKKKKLKCCMSTEEAKTNVEDGNKDNSLLKVVSEKQFSIIRGEQNAELSFLWETHKQKKRKSQNNMGISMSFDISNNNNMNVVDNENQNNCSESNEAVKSKKHKKKHVCKGDVKLTDMQENYSKCEECPVVLNISESKAVQVKNLATEINKEHLSELKFQTKKHKKKEQVAADPNIIFECRENSFSNFSPRSKMSAVSENIELVPRKKLKKRKHKENCISEVKGGEESSISNISVQDTLSAKIDLVNDTSQGDEQNAEFSSKHSKKKVKLRGLIEPDFSQCEGKNNFNPEYNEPNSMYDNTNLVVSKQLKKKKHKHRKNVEGQETLSASTSLLNTRSEHNSITSEVQKSFGGFELHSGERKSKKMKLLHISK